MPTVTVNVKSLTIGLTDTEMAIMQAAIAQDGTAIIAALVASYLQQQQERQRTMAKEQIKAFAETATDTDRASLIGTMNGLRGGRV